jgi:hypothetical protein
MFELYRHFVTDEDMYGEGTQELFQILGEKGGQLVAVVRAENFPISEGGPLKNGLFYHYQMPYGWAD